MIKSKVIPVILCGGSGTRLWPLSRAAFPKQFLVLSSNDAKQSLFQEAIERLSNIDNKNDTKALVITNEEYRFLVVDQVRELQNTKVELILEPEGKNTAPAITLAALSAIEDNPNNDPILIVSPADQTVTDPAGFKQAISNCVEALDTEKDKDQILILGIKPTSPETGYGYIEREKSDQTTAKFGEETVKKFTEKPSLEIAKQYIEDGNYFWNSGIFVLKASTWLKAIAKFRPDILESVKAAWDKKNQEKNTDILFTRPNKELFSKVPAESIDYAVIEKCTESSFTIKMIELDAGWSDLGTWEAVWQVGNSDDAGNVSRGDVIISNSRNSLVYANNRLVGIEGLENIVVVETADAVLVTERSQSQNIKHLVNKLNEQAREEKNLHRKVNRPWGWYDSIEEGEKFKVKRIQVNPGASLSLQSHHHRAEHWIVVKGVATVTNGDEVLTLNENQSTYIPQGQKHRLANLGNQPLEIIEVQSGSYLGEDDIIRFEDVYGRS
jgi:mannose-1-phosphate guanylyltransferase/mannose-6-phosphate isomerase